MHGGEQVSVAGSDLDEDRFSRFRLITWWDQERLRDANVVVIGAGALGNEILKNLALLGVRRIVVVDFDRIEYLNLSRSVLFRADDVGTSKAERAAAAVRLIAPDATVLAMNANVLSEIGLGLFGWADVILAGLDNREARLWINRSAWKMNRPWIDGAIEGINGVARVFLPGRAPCYECTLGETDWAILDKRLSCNLLTREEMLGGKTPTTPTTSSVIAGIQVQEAVKLLHGLPVLAGRGFVFEGLNHSSYVTQYTENPDCLSHYTFPAGLEFPGTSDTTTIAQLHQFACEQLGESNLVIEFSRDVIHQLICPRCRAEQDMFASVGTVSAVQGRCPADDVMREVFAIHNFSGTESFGGRTLRELGLPAFDVFIARTSEREVPILIEGDRVGLLGQLAEFTPIVWPRVQRSMDEAVAISLDAPIREVIHVYTVTCNETGVRVEFAGSVMQQIRRHARSSMKAEICGVLIGRDVNGVTWVEACIEGENAAQGGAHVTFTQETWAYIYKVKDAKFADRAIVGWYHSHPGFGIFLSDCDLFIHENFFAARHQIAWVFDPHSDEEGCFGWVEKKVQPIGRITVTRDSTPVAGNSTSPNPSSRSSPANDRHKGAWEKGKSLAARVPMPVWAGVMLTLSFGAGFVVCHAFFPTKQVLTEYIERPASSNPSNPKKPQITAGAHQEANSPAKTTPEPIQAPPPASPPTNVKPEGTKPPAKPSPNGEGKNEIKPNPSTENPTDKLPASAKPPPENKTPP